MVNRLPDEVREGEDLLRRARNWRAMEATALGTQVTHLEQEVIALRLFVEHVLAGRALPAEATTNQELRSV